MNNDHSTPSAVRDAALEQAANLVELEYAPDATQGRRLAQIAQHIRDLKKRKAEPEAVAPSAAIDESAALEHFEVKFNEIEEGDGDIPIPRMGDGKRYDEYVMRHQSALAGWVLRREYEQSQRSVDKAWGRFQAAASAPAVGVEPGRPSPELAGLAGDRKAFELWYDAQAGGRLNPWDVYQEGMARAIRTGHACKFALDAGGNLYQRYKEPQCAARSTTPPRDQAPEATGEPVTVEALHDESGTVYLPVLRLGGVRLYGKERPRLRWAQAVADSVNAEFAPPQRPQGQEGGV